MTLGLLFLSLSLCCVLFQFSLWSGTQPSSLFPILHASALILFYDGSFADLCCKTFVNGMNQMFWFFGIREISPNIGKWKEEYFSSTRKQYLLRLLCQFLGAEVMKLSKDWTYIKTVALGWEADTTMSKFAGRFPYTMFVIFSGRWKYFPKLFCRFLPFRYPWCLSMYIFENFPSTSCGWWNRLYHPKYFPTVTWLLLTFLMLSPLCSIHLFSVAPASEYITPHTHKKHIWGSIVIEKKNLGRDMIESMGGVERCSCWFPLISKACYREMPRNSNPSISHKSNTTLNLWKRITCTWYKSIEVSDIL